MELKFLTIDDYDEFYKLNSFAFTVSRDISVPVSKHLKDVLKDDSVIKLGAFENDKMISSLIILKIEMNFRNSVIKMGGIGNVCSSSIYRSKGGVKFLMEKTFELLNRENIPISVLYPFSTAFYRKFGYEIFDERKEFIVPPGEIKDFELKSDGYEIIEYSVIDEIDEKLIEELNSLTGDRYNFIVRNREHWKRELTLWMPNDVAKKLILFKNEDEVQGYIICGQKVDDGEGSLTVREFVYKNEEVKRLIFKMLKGLSFQFSKIVLIVPSDFVLWPYVKNYNFIKRKIVDTPMIRIVNLLDLNGMKVDGEDFSLVIKINDKNCEWNNGVFVIELKDGVLYIKKSEENPEIELSIGQLSSVLSGFTNFEELIKMNFIKVNENYSDQDFKKKTTFINQHF
ncbi:MAG: hypothetical protein PWQ77_237 [Kosmotogales bacterium]|nr:hypothetical protein [Kosmotogales bacterium]